MNSCPLFSLFRSTQLLPSVTLPLKVTQYWWHRQMTFMNASMTYSISTSARLKIQKGAFVITQTLPSEPTWSPLVWILTFSVLWLSRSLRWKTHQHPSSTALKSIASHTTVCWRRHSPTFHPPSGPLWRLPGRRHVFGTYQQIFDFQSLSFDKVQKHILQF